MRKIKAQPLTAEAFAPYGTIANMMDPQGYHIGGEFHDFYRDSARFYSNSNLPVGISPLVVRAHGNEVTQVEWHNESTETMLPINDDAIMHVSLAGGGFDPATTKAFIVPKGCAVSVYPGVYHLTPLPVKEKELHAMILLPERAYNNDFYITDLSDDEAFDIEL